MSDSVPGYDADIWLGVWAVAGTPDAVVDAVHAAFEETLKDPRVIDSLGKMGIVVATRSRQDFTAMVEREIAKWARVVAEAGDGFQKQ